MSFLTGKKVLGILAHPDDEVIFGWPIFQRQDVQKYLLTISDNGYCKKQGGNPLAALNEICFSEDIFFCGCLNINANFYIQPVIREWGRIFKVVRLIQEAISKLIREIQPDYIFTHNPVGEYGHGSHEAVFKIVSQHEKVKNLLFTDICLPTEKYISTDGLSDFIKRIFYRGSYWRCVLDTAYAIRCEQVYREHLSWSTTLDIPNKCNLYILKESRGD